MHDINEHGEGSVRNLKVVPGDGSKLVADLEGEKRKADCFRSMSGGQQARIVLEFAIAMARHSSHYVPTMLMLKGIVEILDPYYRDRYCDFLLRREHIFQTIMETPNEHMSLEGLNLMKLQVVRLKGHDRGVTVDEHPDLI